MRVCWTFLFNIFLHQLRTQLSRILLPNPGEICRHLASACNSNIYTPKETGALLFCMQKSSGRTFAIGINLERKHVPKSSASSILFWIRKVILSKPLVLLILPLKSQPLYESKEWRKEGKGEEWKSMSTANKMQVYITRRGQEGGLGVWMAAPLHFAFTWARWYVSSVTICINQFFQ